MSLTLPPSLTTPQLPLFIRKRKENFPKKSTRLPLTKYVSPHSENPQIQSEKSKADSQDPLLQRRIFEYADSFHKETEYLGTFYSTQEVDNDVETDQ